MASADARCACAVRAIRVPKAREAGAAHGDCGSESLWMIGYLAGMYVTSKDGTRIAFDRIGQGSSLILVDGALCYRGVGPSGPLARALMQHFTVFTYDRRGRGESGDTAPYAVEREVEDIEALVNEAGGSAFVWGMSSGAVLALEAANRLRGIKKLAL